MTKEEKNRKIAEALFGRSLDGFGIFAANGARLRERDFDSREEAQQYIDSEDERVPEAHKAAVYGVNIQPCIKAHPDFYKSEEANALLLDRIIEHNRKVLGSLEEAWRHTGNRIGYFMAQNGISDRKTAIAEAFLKWIEQEQAK